jgi:hypothetical protein
LEKTVRNEVPARIFSLGTLFLKVISRGIKGTFSIAPGAFFLATNLKKILFPLVPLDTNVRNNVPSGNILAGTLFPTVTSRET